MKKIFKKSNIFSFLLGALIFSSITAVSAYTILANDIGYTPEDTTWKKSNGKDITNVKDAIDELYLKSNNSYIYGEQTSTNYASYEQVDLGFQPSVLVAIITTSEGYLRTCVYTEKGDNTSYQRSGSLSNIPLSGCASAKGNGFEWHVHDASWGSQTIHYYAWK